MLRDETQVWQCGSHELSLGRPRIMGVLNVTPDSFSDGGEHADTAAAIEWGMRMLDDGATIIDVGGESTRPGFTPVSEKEEAERVVPVVRALAEAGAIVSIDTRHPAIAKMCLRLGASIVNDVTGFTDPAMVEVAHALNCGCVVMHAGEVAPHVARKQVSLDQVMRRTPATSSASAAEADENADQPEMSPSDKNNESEKPERVDKLAAAVAAAVALRRPEPQVASAEQQDRAHKSGADALENQAVLAPGTRQLSSSRHFTVPESSPIMRNVMGFLGDQARMLARAGIDQHRIVLDPGPGFGKMADEDVVIQRATKKMLTMGYPLVCAVSRKRFVGAISGMGDAASRDFATAGVCIAAVESGARILRVHDVAGCAQALDAYWAVSRQDVRRAFVALGSNVGDRLGYLRRAREAIDAIPLTCVVGTSHVYETDPAYGIATPVANCMLELRTELSPLVLLGELLRVEDELGRVRTAGEEGHGPRTIDCDLVWMEGEEHAGRRLALPHPRLGERDFVIVPMTDLMRDAERTLAQQGVKVLPAEQRVGQVRMDLGELS